mmetsp:Transcript_22085/g.56728  ORF Transcript_22085/g.56728 Transcript_22085/m.56728 type:complete len:147 (-) Transcript_22085:189-629(-)
MLRDALDGAGAAEMLADLLEHLLGDATAPPELCTLASKIMYNLCLGAPAVPLSGTQLLQLVDALDHFTTAHAPHAKAAAPAEAVRVASVLLRALRAASPRDVHDTVRLPESDLEPLARPTEADDGERESLSREHTHRPIAHDVSCG